MKIEHFALNVDDPRAMARWYVENLAMRVVRSSDESPYITFLEPADGGTMIELYTNPAGEFLDYGRLHALTFHIAFTTDDIVHDRARLIDAGASADGDITTTAKGDQLAILRDPWGTAVQLVMRA